MQLQQELALVSASLVHSKEGLAARMHTVEDALTKERRLREAAEAETRALASNKQALRARQQVQRLLSDVQKERDTKSRLQAASRRPGGKIHGRTAALEQGIEKTGEAAASKHGCPSLTDSSNETEAKDRTEILDSASKPQTSQNTAALQEFLQELSSAVVNEAEVGFAQLHRS